MMNGFDLTSMRSADPAMLQNQLFRNFFVYTKQDTDAMVALYKLARSETEELINRIHTELDE